jgi:23S rRNA (cytosine1962-C5)-methyltransferase
VPSRVVTISRRGVDRLRGGHPWIYRSDIVDADAEPGDIVRVVTERRRPAGCAFWSSTSQISLRMLGAEPEPPDERELIASRLRAAIAYREALGIEDTAYRLVNAEADRLPGLIVDRYGDGDATYLAIQTLSQGIDRRQALVVELLVELTGARGILARNDVRVRALEGLEERVEVVHGDVPERITVREGRILYEVDPRHGQKTGLFLDQRENHARAARYARGRALDAFTYNGGFALPLAQVCERVIAIDSSAAAVAATAANAQRNRLSNVETREANVFDELRELEIARERFDTIVLDPPAFAKNKAWVERAAAGYNEINLRALKLLAPGGYLITCSCSYNVNEAMFQSILESAAADARATVVLVEKRMQSRDHPVLLNVPETHYLKCLILRRVD